MTWSLSALGHHNTNDWRAEEHELLRSFADACEADGEATTVTSTFTFNGNHVQATSLSDAREKLATYDAESKDASEDDPTTASEPTEQP